MKKMRNFLTLACSCMLARHHPAQAALQKQMKQLPQRLRLLHRQKLLPLLKKMTEDAVSREVT